MGSGRRALGVLVLAAGALAAGCGKKGPPLAPIVHIPAAVETLAARRVGNDVYLDVTIPTRNIDSSTPADIDHLEVFAVTTLAPPPRTRIFDIARRVASIPVQPVPRPGPAGADAPPSPADEALPAQGAVVTIRDTLTPADLLPQALPAPAPRGPALATAAPSPASTPRRYYLAVALNDRGRAGPPGLLLELPLLPLPDPPGALTFSYTPDAVTVGWEPSGGLLGFLLERPLGPEPAPVDERPEASAAAPPPAVGPPLYNVYRELPGQPAPAAGGAGSAAAGVTPPVPINPAPLATLSYTDSVGMQLDQQRCYTVRAVRGTAPNLVIGPPSPRQCLVTVDRFPPEPPTGLSAIAAEGVISLLWEPNGEADLGGYLVLRGRVGDATLQPLTSSPVTETRYADRDVTPGVRYVYAVRAIDTHQPAANVSADSDHVEETAR